MTIKRRWRGELEHSSGEGREITWDWEGFNEEEKSSELELEREREKFHVENWLNLLLHLMPILPSLPLPLHFGCNFMVKKFDSWLRCQLKWIQVKPPIYFALFPFPFFFIIPSPSIFQLLLFHPVSLPSAAQSLCPLPLLIPTESLPDHWLPFLPWGLIFSPPLSVTSYGKRKVKHMTDFHRCIFITFVWTCTSKLTWDHNTFGGNSIKIILSLVRVLS